MNDEITVLADVYRKLPPLKLLTILMALKRAKVEGAR